MSRTICCFCSKDERPSRDSRGRTSLPAWSERRDGDDHIDRRCCKRYLSCLYFIMSWEVEKPNQLKDFSRKCLIEAMLGQSPRPEMSTKNPSFATFSFHGLSVEKKQGRRRGKERRRVKGEDSKHYLQASNKTASDHYNNKGLSVHHTSRDSALGSGLFALGNFVNPCYATRNHVPMITSPNFQPPQGRGSVIAILSIPFGTLWA